jgi:hypothetical protein
MARKIDWEGVRKDYRSGRFSNRELATRYGVSEGGIRKRADQDKWEKDLAAAVRAKTDEKVVRDTALEARAEKTPEDLAREAAAAELAKSAGLEGEAESIIEGAAEANATIIATHRRRAKVTQNLCELLFTQLNEAATERRGIEDDICDQAKQEMQDAGDDKEAKREAMAKRARHLRAVSLPAHAATMRDLANAFKTLVSIEREACGLNNTVDPNEKKVPAVSYDVEF